MKKIRIISFIIAALLFVCAFTVTIRTNMNSGIIAAWVLFVVFIIFGIFYNKIPKFVRILFYICVAILIAAIAFLFIYGQSDNTTGDEDALIVLGAGLRGDVPSKSLAARLDAAAKYYGENPDVIIVVSGGQGADELISEALAMERYLVALGVPEASIIKEDRSTSTAENFTFSKELLDEHFKKPYSVVYTTSDYHIFRAGIIASSCGIENATHTSGSSPWYTIISSGIRECMAVARFILLQK